MDITTLIIILVVILLIAGIMDAVYGFRVFWAVLDIVTDMLMWISIFNLFSDDD